jgi:ribose 5-phosphate isomerase B
VRIAIGSDHRGYAHKSALIEALTGMGHELRDCGCDSAESADYTDAALAVAAAVGAAEAERGILICGSGIGMSIAANKVAGVRASLCFDTGSARTTRQHNDSNVLCLSGDAVAPDLALAMAEVWLATDFEGGRHARRVDKIRAYESEHIR